MSGLDPGRDLRVGDKLCEEDPPVAEDEVAAARHHAPLREHDQRRPAPLARKEPPSSVELKCVRVPFGGCVESKKESVRDASIKLVRNILIKAKTFFLTVGSIFKN